MSATGNGTTRYLDTAATIVVPVGSYSYSFWYKPNHVPNNAGATTNPMALVAGGGSTQDIGVTWDQPGPTLYKSFVHIQVAGGACRVQFSGVPAANVWHHFAITWDGTTLSLYHNGVLNNTATGTNPPAVNPKVTVLAYDSGASGFDDAAIAELTIWNVTLTAAQAFSLGTGTLATAIANANIIFYSTLNTGDPGAIGPALTNHSTVINNSYFDSVAVDVAIGGTGFPNIYAETMTIGFALGGNASIVTQTTANGAAVVSANRSDAFTTK